MAKILFVMKYPLHRQENLQVKFDGQMAAVRALGHEPQAIGWDEEGMWLIGEGERQLLRRNCGTRMPGYDHTKIFTDLMAAVREVLRREKVDLLYLRYMPTFGNAVRAMRMLKAQGGKFIMEIPTYPNKNENKRSLLRRPVFAYTDRVLRRIHPMVDLYTVIGQDCGGDIQGQPAMNIVNGVYVPGVPLHEVNQGTADIHLLALASMAKWHGYDRLLRSLADYQGTENVFVHLVGSDGDGSLTEWKALAEALGLMDRVTFHGALHGEALNNVVAQCDVGIGCLAVFRFGFSGSMSLKIREYMARGLPFVYAEDDPSIPEDARFCMRVSNDEAPIDMAKIAAFAKACKQRPEVPALMRAYATEHMSWEAVMKSVLERLGL